MENVPFALQLYSIRDHLEQDVPGTLRRVKDMGYDNVELAGLYGYAPAEFKRLLDDAGLRAISAHMPYEEVTGNTAEVQSTLATLGIDQAVVPWIGADECPDEAAWLERARAMAQAGAHLREAGLTLSYHNHAHEFQKIDGRYIFDIMLESVDPNHLSAEIDTYWVQFGGADVVETLQRYSGRVPLVHIKDMAPDPPHGFAEVGRGIMDWSTIMPIARDAGAQWFIVEQDECEGDSLEAVAVSAAFMAEMTI